MQKQGRPTIDRSKLYAALYRHAEHSGQRFSTKHPHAVDFFSKHGITPGQIREHATRLLGSGAVATTLLLSSPLLSHIPKAEMVKHGQLTLAQREKQFADALRTLLPEHITPLSSDQEEKISDLVRIYWGIDARATLQGERLNHSYGYIGAEQHLPRFPGDTIGAHDEYQRSGITPGRGAWGYFANSRTELTEDLIQKEKYYVAVQTLYVPEWNTRTKYLKDWYKHRKVVVVNPANGKLIVCVIADAGPAKFTGKQFGGSPEVMAYLGLNVGKQKGKVILFFVEDPQDSLALGPLEYNGRGSELASQ